MTGKFPEVMKQQQWQMQKAQKNPRQEIMKTSHLDQLEWNCRVQSVFPLFLQGRIYMQPEKNVSSSSEN